MIFYCPACRENSRRRLARRARAAEERAAAGLPPAIYDPADPRQRWCDLRWRYPHQLARAIDPGELYPDPLSQENLGRLVWTLLSPKYRPLLAELLLDLLADGIRDSASEMLARELPAVLRYLLKTEAANGTA